MCLPTKQHLKHKHTNAKILIPTFNLSYNIINPVPTFETQNQSTLVNEKSPFLGTSVLWRNWHRIQVFIKVHIRNECWHKPIICTQRYPTCTL
jgi:hypothetical protein